jgi:hypothetical protein
MLPFFFVHETPVCGVVVSSGFCGFSAAHAFCFCGVVFAVLNTKKNTNLEHSFFQTKIFCYIFCTLFVSIVRAAALRENVRIRREREAVEGCQGWRSGCRQGRRVQWGEDQL